MEGMKKILILRVVLVTAVAAISYRVSFDAIPELSCLYLCHFVSLDLTTKSRSTKPHSEANTTVGTILRKKRKERKRMDVGLVLLAVGVDVVAAAVVVCKASL
jgi:hypothetical protein